MSLGLLVGPVRCFLSIVGRSILLEGVVGEDGAEDGTLVVLNYYC